VITLTFSARNSLSTASTDPSRVAPMGWMRFTFAHPNIWIMARTLSTRSLAGQHNQPLDVRTFFKRGQGMHQHGLHAQIQK
jgi:hypothetical protein